MFSRLLWLVIVCCQTNALFDPDICFGSTNVTCRFLSPKGKDTNNNPCINHKPHTQPSNNRRRLWQFSPDPSPGPTPAPTPAPSPAPTPSPSNQTMSPTPFPTSDPTTEPTWSPTEHPSTSPTVAPSKSPTVPPTFEPTLNPTYPTCHGLDYVMTVTNDHEVIIFEAGNYRLNYAVDIIGFSNIIFSGLPVVPRNFSDSASTLQFHFDSTRLFNKTSFFNIINCDNLTFQILRFEGHGSHQYADDIRSLFRIVNSSNIRFENVLFTEFNITNPLNDSAEPDNDELFNLIRFNHKYEGLTSYPIPTASHIPQTLSTPHIQQTNCSYVVDKNSPSAYDKDAAFQVGFCQIDHNKSQQYTLSFKYECFETGNGLYGLIKTVYNGSDDCTHSPSTLHLHVNVTTQYFNASDETMHFYCGLPSDILSRACSVDIIAYDVQINSVDASCTKGDHMLYKHVLLPNGCVSRNHTSTGYVCVDDQTLFKLSYQDTQCSSLIQSTYIGKALMDQQCFLNKLYLELSCPAINTHTMRNKSYSMQCIECVFIHNELHNANLIQSIAWTQSRSSALVNAGLAPLEVSLIGTRFINNLFTEQGVIMYLRNVITNIEHSVFMHNTNDHAYGNDVCGQHLICFLYDSNALIYYFMDFNDYPYISRIAYTQFSAHSSNILYFESTIDMDRTIFIESTSFMNNSIPQDGQILYFASYSDGLYFGNYTSITDYCYTRLCGVRLWLYDSHFTNNTMRSNVAMLRINVEHNFNVSSSFKGELGKEISIQNSTFIGNYKAHTYTALSALSTDMISIAYRYYVMRDYTGVLFVSSWIMLDVSDTMLLDNDGGLVFNYLRDTISLYDSTDKFININNSQFINTDGIDGFALMFANLGYIYLNLKYCNLSNNNMGNEGGALHMDCSDGSIVDIAHCHFVNNTASDDGGAISVNVMSSDHLTHTTADPTTAIPSITPTIEPTTESNVPTNEPTTEPTNQPTINAAISSTIAPTLTPNLVPTARRRSLWQWGPHVPTNTPTALMSSPTNVPSGSPTDRPTIDPTHVVARTFDLAIYDTTAMTINVHSLNSKTDEQNTDYTVQWNFINGLCSNPQLNVSIAGPGQDAFRDGIITFYSDAARTNIIGECNVRSDHQLDECNVWQTCFSDALWYITDGIQSLEMNVKVTVIIFDSTCLYSLNMNVTLTCTRLSIPPTEEPTNKPTTLTSSPTSSPSGSPTIKPTLEPTKPTNDPTAEPTTNPTGVSGVPSPFPSKVPTTPAPTFGKQVLQCPTISISHSVFTGNNAANSGGALHLQYNPKVECMKAFIHDTRFEDNMVNGDGGAIFMSRTNLDVPSESPPNQSINVSLNLKSVRIIHNIANRTGGGLYFADDSSCINMASNVATISDSYIANNSAHYYGAGVYAECVEMHVKDTMIASNVITFSGDYRTSSKERCTDDKCLKTNALNIDEAFGGSGAGIYSLSSSMIIQNNIFIGNRINLGNGGAFAYKLNLNDNRSLITLRLKLVNNMVSNNDICLDIANIESDAECVEYAGLVGFAAGFWIEIKSTQYEKLSIVIKDNVFEWNQGMSINDLYFNIYDRESLKTMKWLLKTNYSNNMFGNDTNAYGSSPVRISDVATYASTKSLAPKSDDDTCKAVEGCLGYILPGESVFEASFKLRDIYGQSTTGLLACSHLIYSLSQEVELARVHFEDQVVRLQFQVTKAVVDKKLFLNMSDRHAVITARDNVSNISVYVITTLCSAGQEVTFLSDHISVCNAAQMSEKEFRCGSDCSQGSYLFTQWEHKCNSCKDKNGVTCNGQNEVVLDYAYWAQTHNTSYLIPSSNNIHVCKRTFDTFLCPVGLCCTEASGCSFDGYNTTVLCARNRDPNSKFCGKCLPHHYEVIGTYACSPCDKDQTSFLLYYAIGGIMLLIYLLQRNPLTVTSLFTYWSKSLLYFYQIMPILTYETKIGLWGKVCTLFNMSFVYNIFDSGKEGTNPGVCLFNGMTGLGKLFSNFLSPGILLTELLILRLVPEIIKWCYSFELNAYDVVYDIDGESASDRLLAVSDGNRQDLSVSEMMRKEIRKEKSLNFAQKLRKHASQAAWNVFLILYITLCQGCINLFNCAKVGDKRYLWYSGENECWVGVNAAIQSIAVICFVALAAFPIYIVWRLRKLSSHYMNKHHLKQTEIKDLRKKHAVFVTSYKSECWYYEAVLMLRRIALLLVYAFPKSKQILLRTIMSFMCIIILSIHIKLAPFVSTLNNRLETASLLVLCFVSTLSIPKQNIGQQIIGYVAALPLIPLPFLIHCYCQQCVVPTVKRSIAFSTELIRYVPPTIKQNNIDNDFGNVAVHEDIEDDQHL
eukprot:449166_1